MEVADLSSWQGDIDFDLLCPHLAGAIVRGGDGAYVDPRQAEYTLALAARRVPQDVYHFMRWAYTPVAAAAQARASWDRAARWSGGQVGRLWLDAEDTSDACKAVPVQGRIDWFGEVRNRLNDLPKGTYTAGWWWRPYMGDTPLFAEDPGWLAVYPFNNSVLSAGSLTALIARYPWFDKAPLCGGWTDWAVWQFTSQAALPGITQNTVDLNVARIVIGKEENMAQLDDIEARLIRIEQMCWVLAETNQRVKDIMAAIDADETEDAKAIADEIAKRLRD